MCHFSDSNKNYVHSFGSTSRSWTNLSQYNDDLSDRSSSIPRVTYRRLEKIASYHYLPRVILNGSLKKSQSHQSVNQIHQNLVQRRRSSSSSTNQQKQDTFLPLYEFGSLDSLTSVTTFSYIASRDQREREEDIYEVKPSTMVIRKKPKVVPRITELLMQQSQNYADHHKSDGGSTTGTCLRCHRPKILA